ncbi:MAG: PDZ domain-containing protein [Gammaproteobacteria bacterium]
MKKTMIAMAVAALLAAGDAQGQAAEEEADLEQRLQAAQERLEAAAREVAELSSEMGGAAGHQIFEMRLPNPRRAMLGINLGATEGDGVRVNNVSPGGPAAEAGVKAGDVIMSIEGKKVATGRELVKVMEGVEPGQKVALELERGGKPVQVAVEARPLDRSFFAGRGLPAPAIAAIEALPAMPHEDFEFDFGGGPHWLLEAWGDAEFVNLTPGLGRYFGAVKGVLVARAPEDSTLGLQDGDVIVAIGGREPQNARHAMRILRSYQPGETVEIRVLRDKRTQSLAARVPERSEREVRKHKDVLRHRVVPAPRVVVPPPAPRPPPQPEAPPST